MRVAALVHDASLSDHPELVDGVGAAAGLALENERLQAQVRARLEDLRGRGRGSSRPPTPNGGGWSATSTMACSSGSSLSLSLALAERRFAGHPATCEVPSRRARSSRARSASCESSRAASIPRADRRGLGAALEALAGRATCRSTPRECPRAPAARRRGGRLLPGRRGIDERRQVRRRRRLRPSASREDSQLLVEVADDGIGGADASRGSGIRGLAIASRRSTADSMSTAHRAQARASRPKSRSSYAHCDSELSVGETPARRP